MREIKFRGQRKFENHCWVYGYMVKEVCGDVWIFPEGDTYCNAGGDFYSENEPGIRMVEPETVGQYTGLKDKNGKEIYEGDVVVRHSSICGSIDDIGVVKYDEEKAMFVLYCQEKLHATSFHFLKGQTINDGYCTFSETFTYEVIGNIHDTPELLKKN